jgi:hypothetical protein
MLVVKGKVYNLRDEGDFRDYQRHLFEAGSEIIEIRGRMYEGQEDRAKAVIDGRAPPMFRRNATVGYRNVVVYHEGAGRWTTNPGPHGTLEPMMNRGVVIKTWAKCASCGPWVEALRDELHRQGTLADVARAMNRRGIPGPWASNGHKWKGQLIRQVLQDPTYWGRWYWVRTPSKTTDLWFNIDVRGYWTDRYADALAYWTENEARIFAARFLQNRPSRRFRAIEHTIVGLVACPGCGDPFLAAGGCKTRKEGAKLRCRNYRNGKCPHPVCTWTKGARGERWMPHSDSL